MGIYIYNESEFLKDLEKVKRSFVLNEIDWIYISELAKYNHSNCNDKIREFFNILEENHKDSELNIINYSKTLSVEQWSNFMSFIDSYLFESNIWCELFENATEEQKEFYFENN